jgi:hypothetical protein
MTDMTWSQTRGGVRWDFATPNEELVDWYDIAHALSNLCRFNGHTSHHYSVAEHSVHVHDTVAKLTDDQNIRLYALLHDAHEAYLGDVTTPLANTMSARLPGFAALWGGLKDAHDTAIFQAAEIILADPAEAYELVKGADVSVMMAERDQLMANTPERWGELEDVKRAKITVGPWTPEEAKWEFLQRLKSARPQLLHPTH